MSDLSNNNTESQENESIQQQGIPSVANKNSLRKSKKSAGKLLLAASVLGLAVILYSLSQFGDFLGAPEEENNKSKLKDTELTSSTTITKPVLPSFEKKNTEKPVVLQTTENVNKLKPLESKEEAKERESFTVSNSNNKVEPSLEQLKFAAPMMGSAQNSNNSRSSSYSDSDKQAILDNYNKMMENAGSSSGFGGSEKAAPSLTDQVKSMPTPSTQARLISKPSLTLGKGTIIDCILETRVDTSVPGMTTCVIPQNVYSMDGRVLLVEKGTKAIGEYQGSVQNGLARIFMLWSELRTPEGIAIQIDSPTADSLGGAGAGGHVDFHWWKRFGNALMFSMVSDAFEYGITTAQKSNSNSNVTYDNTNDGINEIIKAAMEQSGKIPPTLIKNQGEKVSIFIARDVDFSSVYSLNKKGNTNGY